MHATIAAFSSGVPVIPTAYSRKFVGLFNGVGYKNVVDLRELSTQQSVKRTIEYLVNIENMKEDIEKYQLDSEFLAGFYNELFHIAFADGEFTKEEDKMMTNLRETFKLPFVVR